MQRNKKPTADIDTAYIVQCGEEVKTTTQFSTNYNIEKIIASGDVEKTSWYTRPAFTLYIHFITLTILGLVTWGLLWCAWGDDWLWDGQWFRLALVAVIAWGSGQVLQRLTTLPPLIAALLTGILARNLGILDMRNYIQIDFFLRKVYPVIILGKASLGWNVNYMKCNWSQMIVLGVLPWTAEVVTLAVSTRLFLDFPWIWGFLMGSIYSSVSCAVVMASVQRHNVAAGYTHDWPQLVATAGGMDTALSVGVYGVIHSFMFYDSDDIYRYVKAALTLFVGVGMGVIWGSLARLVPHPSDYYVTELRVLSVLLGGLLANFLTSLVGWSGAGGVAVLVCNATAATYWSRGGWKLNNNPASTAYRVLWTAFEPLLFAYTGTFFVIDSSMSQTMLWGIVILLICLTIRLMVTTLVCWKFTLKEKIFICCTWIPKSIVEAVLCPVAIETLMIRNSQNDPDTKYAEQLMSLIVQAILITTPIGFLLTHYLGPILLKKTQINDARFQKNNSLHEPQNEDIL